MSSSFFNKTHTEIAKGLAVILLLWHHLYYMHPEYGWLVYHTAKYSKVCVHIFLILSGYGLFFSMRKLEQKGKKEFNKLFGFYYPRFLSLMPKYWIVFILGVGISMLLFNKMPEEVFKETSHPWIWLGLQSLGLHMIEFKGYGYNPTWWYMTTIILLYFIFPYLYVMINEYPISAWIGLTVFFRFFQISAMDCWGIPFVLGMFLARKSDNFPNMAINDKCIKKAYIQVFGGGIFVIVICLCVRYLKVHLSMIWMTSLGMDITLLAIPLSNLKFIGTILSFIGKHSYNIFLIHTFINFWILFKFIYKFPSSPLWSLPLLFGLSLICSICVNIIYKNLEHTFTYFKTKIFQNNYE